MPCSLLYRARTPASLLDGHTEASAQVHRRCQVFILVHVLCSKDLYWGWILGVLWSFPLVCFGLLGMFLSFKTSIRQGSSRSDSSTDQRGTCGRKIRLKCAGCNRCGGWVKRRGKWCSSYEEVRGDAVVRRWNPCWLRVLKGAQPLPQGEAR